MTASLVYTMFFHVLPELDMRKNYLYAHCTVTGDGHWEKYETVYGIKERVVVPVEVRIGTIEGALDWDGVDPLNSTDVYHQGIGRDKPSGWEYFTKDEKQNYLKTYKPGREYECWMRPGSGTNEVVFHRKAVSFRLMPEIVFCIIVLFLCVATGVCMGMVDIIRAMIGLPQGDDFEDEDQDMAGVAAEKYGDYGSVAVSNSIVHRQFGTGGYGDAEGDREWV